MKAELEYRPIVRVEMTLGELYSLTDNFIALSAAAKRLRGDFENVPNPGVKGDYDFLSIELSNYEDKLVGLYQRLSKEVDE